MKRTYFTMILIICTSYGLKSQDKTPSIALKHRIDTIQVQISQRQSLYLDSIKHIEQAKPKSERIGKGENSIRDVYNPNHKYIEVTLKKKAKGTLFVENEQGQEDSYPLLSRQAYSRKTLKMLRRMHQNKYTFVTIELTLFENTWFVTKVLR